MAKKKKKPDFPNNWEAIEDCPDSFFYPIPFDEFMDWKIFGYEIPSSIDSIIREHNLETGKVTEYVYRTLDGGKKRAKRIMDEGKSEFIVCTHEQVHHVYPETINEDEEDLF
tara:strand:+ start:438 stop:773 length:336 start_codon:yes stop_codon:yes gene_type:complete